LRSAERIASETLFQMLRDELCHLEHRNGLFAVENCLQHGIGIDVAAILGVLKFVFLDVVPKLLREFRAGKWLRSDDFGQSGVRLHRLQESGVWLTSGFFLCGFGSALFGRLLGGFFSRFFGHEWGVFHNFSLGSKSKNDDLQKI
jgi:hypothetical protein